MIADPYTADALAGRLKSLKMPTPTGAPTSRLALELAGRTLRVEPNADGIETIAFELDPDGVTLVVGDGEREQRVRVGYRTWSRGELALPRFPGPGYPPSAALAAAGAWVDALTYVLHLWSYETPWRNVWTCYFEDDRLQIERATHPLSSTNPVPTPLKAAHATLTTMG